MEKTISERNVIIARFINGKLESKDGPNNPRWSFGPIMEPIGEEAPHFESDWNWLMRVWNKIALLSVDNMDLSEMEIGKRSCTIKALKHPYIKGGQFMTVNFMEDFQEMNLHRAVYESVFEFVVWFNENILGK